MSDTTYKSKVGYQSPIKLNQTLEWEEGTADKISKYIAGEIDNLILESCMKVVCDVNEEELLKALQYDRGQYEKGYADGKRDAQPHWVSVFDDLPRHNAVVVVSDGKRSWDVGQYHFLVDDDDRTRWWWKKHTTRKVLWWMYKEDALPEPPKEEE